MMKHKNADTQHTCVLKVFTGALKPCSDLQDTQRNYRKFTWSNVSITSTVALLHACKYLLLQ